MKNDFHPQNPKVLGNAKRWKVKVSRRAKNSIYVDVSKIKNLITCAKSIKL
jgi:hypothetical protein